MCESGYYKNAAGGCTLCSSVVADCTVCTSDETLNPTTPPWGGWTADPVRVMYCATCASGKMGSDAATTFV